MDPTTRRYLWDVLTGITQEGRSIVLTSHRYVFTQCITRNCKLKGLNLPVDFIF